MTGNCKKKGFSMVELLISGVVFSIVFGVAMAVFVNTTRVQKYNMAHQQLMDQASYTIEYLARSLRMAKREDTGSCIGQYFTYIIVGGGKGIRFKNYQDECVEFFWDDVAQELRITITDDFLLGPFRLNAIPLNSSNYPVTKLTFSIDGERQTDSLQPRATVFMEMEDIRLMSNNPRTSVQTTVSQRNLDE